MTDSGDRLPSYGALPTGDRVLQTTIAIILSLLFAGAGQAYNRQWWKMVAAVIGAFALWFVLLGWVVHLWAMVDAGVVRWFRTGSPDARDRSLVRSALITLLVLVLCAALMIGAFVVFGRLAMGPSH